MLVDENLVPHYGTHAGGIAYHDGLLHVADSKSGQEVKVYNKVRVFNVTDIRKLDHDYKVFNYEYILIE